MAFTTDLVVKWRKDEKWELVETLVYQGQTETFIMPPGLVTDFASVPKCLRSIFPNTGLYTQAAVVHDYLYDNHMVSRKDADGIFRRIMREAGVGRLSRYTMWGACRLFGWAAWKK